MEDEAEIRSRPEINKNYRLKKPYIPVQHREPKVQNFDKQLDQRRKNDKHRYIDEMEECTFKPKINDSSKNDIRKVDDLLKWGDEKKMKLVQKRLHKLHNMEEFGFTPEISEVSKLLAERRKKKTQDEPLHERLMKAGEETKKKRAKMLKAEQKKMFKPRLNKKSKQILEKKKEGLTKMDNGKTENLDFFHAIPTESLKKSLASTAKRKKIPKSSQGPRKAKNKKTAVETKRGSKISKKTENTIKKKKDPLPDYMSPYNKKVMTSNVPLTKVLAKSQIHRQNLKKRKDDKNAKRKKNKSLAEHNNMLKKRLGYVPNKGDMTLKEKSNPLDFYTGKKPKNSASKTLSQRKKRAYEYGNKNSKKNMKKMEQKKQKDLKNVMYPDGDIGEKKEDLEVEGETGRKEEEVREGEAGEGMEESPRKMKSVSDLGEHSSGGDEVREGEEDVQTAVAV